MIESRDNITMASEVRTENIYTTGTYRGQHVQRFIYKGLGPVIKEDQGVVWPVKK